MSETCAQCRMNLMGGFCEACRQQPAFIKWHGRGYWDIALCAACWLALPQIDRQIVCQR